MLTDEIAGGEIAATEIPADAVRFATVIVIGAGQAGLSAGFHLQRRGFESALDAPAAERTFVMLDANPRAGGAWQHRWESLTMATVNGIFDLPTFARIPGSDDEPSRDAVPRYFAEFEDAHPLPIARPVRVLEVTRVDTDPHGDFLVRTDSAGTWRASAIINATGTWNNPLLPSIPGQESFLGRQLHTRDYVSAEEFAGQRVAIVGGGISAVQQLEEISRGAQTFWYTRREPVFLERGFNPEVEGRATIAKVTADVEAGDPASSVVSYTGLGWSPYAIAARDRGALVRRPMFTAIEPEGVREADGSFTPVDAILWATGFRADLAHLESLGLRNERGGITMRGTQVVDEPRIHLIGFGPSQSTVGANRAGRDAVRAIEKLASGASDPASDRREPAASR
ncbi:MAG: NAD(P)-binding domain-containing protein [Pseudoclavibacter sp.]